MFVEMIIVLLNNNCGWTTVWGPLLGECDPSDTAITLVIGSSPSPVQDVGFDLYETLHSLGPVMTMKR